MQIVFALSFSYYGKNIICFNTLGAFVYVRVEKVDLGLDKVDKEDLGLVKLNPGL